MSWLFDFPHTRNYDDDLSWLIAYYKKLESEYSNINDTVKKLEESYDTIPKQVSDAVKVATANIRSELVSIKHDFLDLKNYTGEQLADFSNRLLLATLAIKQGLLFLKSYVDNENIKQNGIIIAYINDILKDHNYAVICPVDCRLENIQTCLYHICNYYSLGVPVEVLDSLNINVSEFDNRKYEVLEFDRYGFLIFKNYKYFYMFSPFTGQYVPVTEVTLDLAKLHMNGVEVSIFDGKNIIVEDFDSANHEVYAVDWNGNNIFNAVTIAARKRG